MKKRSTISRLKEEENSHKIRQWSEGLNPDSGPVGQDDRPVVSQEIDRGGKREGDNQRITPKRKAWRRWGSLRFMMGQRVNFRRSYTPARALFYFLVVFIFRCK
jgi:hypothetical protein